VFRLYFLYHLIASNTKGMSQLKKTKWRYTETIWIRGDSKNEIIIHFIIDKAVLKFGNEVWVLKESDEQTLEASQMKFFN